MKTILSVAAIAAVLSGPAFAQQAATPVAAAAGTTATVPNAPSKTPDTTKPAAPVDTAATTMAPADTTTITPTTPAAAKVAAAPAMAPAGEIRYLPSQTGGEFLASRVMGAVVMNDAGESIGKVNDIILDKQGSVTGVVIGVGGFLGIGEQNVAIAYVPSQISTDANGVRVIKLNVTKVTLQAAPKYVKLDKAS